MADDKLISASAADGLVKRVDPEIVTKAKPKASVLLRARAEVNLDKDLGEAFKAARTEESTPESLADTISVRLAARWQGVEFSDVWESALYLADEFFQVGEGIHVVSSETGRIVATLDEKDIYQPAPVPREGGGMATPLKRVRPDILGYITTWTFERSHEARVVEALTKRGHQTDLQREEGDPRLLVATRKGRALIVDALSKLTPKELLRACGGTSAAFLSHFTIESEPPIGLMAYEGTAVSRSEIRIVDQTTVNLSHDRAATLRGALVQGWVRDIARAISVEAHLHKGGNLHLIDVHELRRGNLGTSRFWIAPPDAVASLKDLDPTLDILPIEGAKIVGLLPGVVGILVVPEEFQAGSAEMFDRWAVNAKLPYKVYVVWDRVNPLNVGGISHMAEVLAR